MAKERSIVLVLPRGSAEVSGGNLYNAGLLQALRRRASVSVVDAEEWLASESRASIVLVDTLDLQACATAFSNPVPGQKIVLLVHHLPSLEPGSAAGDAARQLEVAVLPQFDGFLTTSAFCREHLASRMPTARVLSLQPPVEVREPAAMFRPEHRIRALMACNLIQRKGVLPFLECLADLCVQGDFQIDILGRDDIEPDYARACTRIVRERLATRVHLHGVLPHSEMASWYQQASLLVSASRMETFGISLQEARHYGLAILAVRGGNTENHVVDQVSGELCETPRELAERFAALVAKPALLVEYSRAALTDRPIARSTWADAAAGLLAALDTWFGKNEEPCH